MEIEEIGKIESFEPIPHEATLYLTAVYYPNPSGYWAPGPGGMDKSEVIRMVSVYTTGISKARIYSVKVPLKKIDSA